MLRSRVQRSLLTLLNMYLICCCSMTQCLLYSLPSCMYTGTPWCAVLSNSPSSSKWNGSASSVILFYFSLRQGFTLSVKDYLLLNFSVESFPLGRISACPANPP